MLSLGFITPLSDSVLLRVDSEREDYLEVETARGNVFVSYNLGTEDIVVGEANVRVDDGKYHVVRYKKRNLGFLSREVEFQLMRFFVYFRFTRSGANSTLQVDDNQVLTVSKIRQNHGNLPQRQNRAFRSRPATRAAATSSPCSTASPSCSWAESGTPCSAGSRSHSR